MSDQVKMTDMNYDNDRPAAENPIKIMDLSLRDGHQSLFATRGRTEDMIPVAELMTRWVSGPWRPGAAPPLTPCIAFSMKIPGSAFVR